MQINGEDELLLEARPVNIEITPRSFIGGVEVCPPASLVKTLASVERNIFRVTEGEAGGVWSPAEPPAVPTELLTPVESVTLEDTISQDTMYRLAITNHHNIYNHFNVEKWYSLLSHVFRSFVFLGLKS